MNEKDKLVIAKLIKIAKNQQKIIEKLAQTIPGHDPIIDYINTRLVSTVAANLQLPGVLADTTEGTDAGIGTYISNISNVPADKQDAFKQAAFKQLQLQKPQLVGKITLTFN